MFGVQTTLILLTNSPGVQKWQMWGAEEATREW